MKTNHRRRAVKVFLIHMAVIVVGSILIGIFGSKEMMWGIGGFTSFFMIGFHLAAIENARDKDDV